jgi:hypothetical protein
LDAAVSGIVPRIRRLIAPDVLPDIGNREYLPVGNFQGRYVTRDGMDGYRERESEREGESGLRGKKKRPGETRAFKSSMSAVLGWTYPAS